jgi:hypothetical protein
MKSVADNPVWHHIDTEVDQSFGQEPRNLRFRMALDGVNPFPHTNSTHSTWLVLMLIYNVPPYLVTKFFFIQLCILISRKMSPTNENIDVFICPLLEELLEFWRGVPVQDFAKPGGDCHFQLRAILIWTIIDYPGYGLISGLCTHGRKGCTVCRLATESRTAKSRNKVTADKRVKGRKTIYGGSRKWTHRHHPYRRDRNFNGEEEFGVPLEPMSGEETARWGLEREQYLANSGRENGSDDPVHRHGVKRHSFLDEFPYWRVSFRKHFSSFVQFCIYTQCR